MSFLNDCIYINNTAISKYLCNDIIQMFEDQVDGKFEGLTAGGLNKNIKDTTDYIIPRNKSNNYINDINDINIKKWAKIDSFLEEELNRNVKIYVKQLTTKLNIEEENSNYKFKLFPSDKVNTTEFMIQRYIQGRGRYIYHNDSRINWQEKKYRLITYIFYLNTVEEGGETEFFNELRIKPEVGKLVLFPASWLWPHRGMIPKSSNKYIITGWLYVNE
jgi:prolyl 4-hydroxylase